MISDASSLGGQLPLEDLPKYFLRFQDSPGREVKLIKKIKFVYDWGEIFNPTKGGQRSSNNNWLLSNSFYSVRRIFCEADLNSFAICF